MMKVNYIFSAIVTVVSLSFFTSCNNSDVSSTSKFNVTLTDSPGDYSEVNVDVSKVQIHATENDSTSDWKDLSQINASVYNLLDFVNGKDTLLASEDLPAGTISQIRLILGSNNTLKLKDGTVVNLTTPSAQQSGIKLNIDATLKAGIAYTLKLDFDAAKSIVKQGNGKYLLKPVIRSFLEATSGAIQGVVLPVAAHPNIEAVMGTDTITTYPDSTGNYMIKGLNAGTYKVIYKPISAFESDEEDSVVVTTGNVTTIPTVTLDSIQ